jgi:preprotein translocase subunit SecE
MPDTSKTDKRMIKTNKPQPRAMGKFVAFFVKIGKRLKNFFINMKAEVKRIVWPDRKRLIQNTATVLAICLLAGLLLFIIDFALGKFLTAVGFYNPSSTTVVTTTVATTASSSETTSAATSSGETTSSTTTATTQTTAATTTSAG